MSENISTAPTTQRAASFIQDVANLDQQTINSSALPINILSNELPEYYKTTLANASRAENLPPLARKHIDEIQNGGFRISDKSKHPVEKCRLWYEGTFDPIGPHHLMILREALSLGFRRAVLAVVHQNPLKSDSTPFEHRVEMAKIMLRDAGIKIAENADEDGVFIYRDADALQHQKIRGWFDEKTIILMGPDNFESYIRNNVIWAHAAEIRSHNLSEDYFGFQNLYNRLIQDRVLVYTNLHDYHATAIRKGLVEPPPMLKRYIDAHGLYPRVIDEKTTRPNKPTILSLAAIKSQNASQLRQAVASDISELIREHGLEPLRFTKVIEQTLKPLDESKLLSLQETLDIAVATEVGESKVSKLMQQLIDPAELEEYHIEQEPQSRFRPADPVISQLRSLLLANIIDSEFELTGIDHVLKAFKEHKHIVFVSNHCGSSDLALIPYGLAVGGASAIGERLTFVVQPETFKDEFEAFIIGHAIHTIGGCGSVEQNGETQVTIDHLVKRLKKGDFPVIFPEDIPHRSGLGMFSSAYLKAFEPDKLLEKKIDVNRVVFIPCHLERAEALLQPHGTYTSEDSPLRIHFGAAIALNSLFAMATQDRPESKLQMAANILGLKVADLGSTESRGVYGVNPEKYIGIEGINQRHINLINEARSAVETHFANS